MSIKVAVVGAGSQGVVHANAYRQLPGVELVGVADADAALAARVGAQFDIPSYASGEELLATHPVDVLSICTPPAWHRSVTEAAIKAGVRAIHSEKPVAKTYGDAVAMVQAAREADVQLTINLQRRFEPVHQFARERIAAGAIGEVQAIRAHAANLFDWGTHIVDLMLFYLGDRDPQWVDGQVDVTRKRFIYGIPAETSSLSDIGWDGVAGVLRTGRGIDDGTDEVLANTHLIVDGSEGRLTTVNGVCTIQRFDGTSEAERTPWSTDTSTWHLGVDPAIEHCTRAALADVVESLVEGRESVLDAKHALAGAAIIFGTYESSRQRARVPFPLVIEGHPLIEGLEAGLWTPTGEPEYTTF